MREKRKKEVEVEVSVCNICGLEVDKEPFNKKRIEIVRHLFSTQNFDAHEGCINAIVKTTFEKFMVESPPTAGKESGEGK